jgi:hypothetical protein
MSDAPNGAGAVPPQSLPAHPPFPAIRLLWSIGYGFLAWLAFWLLIVLAVIQFVLVAVNGHANDEVKRFSRGLILYLSELLAYLVFLSDDQPFPVGPFPQTTAT